MQKKNRSNQQNRFYWGAVIPAVTAFFREHGNNVDADEVHDFLKLHVGKLDRVIVMPDDTVKKTLGSTASLTTSEFMDYIAKIQAWGAELGCIIPIPNEAIY